MNNENLKRGNPDTQFKSGRSAVENGRKGGKKTAENKRKKKDLRDAMIAILEASYPDKNTGNMHTGIEVIVTELFKAATDRKSRNYNRSLDTLLALTGYDKSPEEKKRIEHMLKLQEQEIKMNQQKIDANDEWN